MVIFYKKWKKKDTNSINKKKGLKQSKNYKLSTRHRERSTHQSSHNGKNTNDGMLQRYLYGKRTKHVHNSKCGCRAQ